jgi:hypothetical protein
MRPNPERMKNNKMVIWKGPNRSGCKRYLPDMDMAKNLVRSPRCICNLNQVTGRRQEGAAQQGNKDAKEACKTAAMVTKDVGYRPLLGPPYRGQPRCGAIGARSLRGHVTRHGYLSIDGCETFRSGLGRAYSRPSPNRGRLPSSKG